MALSRNGQSCAEHCGGEVAGETAPASAASALTGTLRSRHSQAGTVAGTSDLTPINSVDTRDVEGLPRLLSGVGAG